MRLTNDSFPRSQRDLVPSSSVKILPGSQWRPRMARVVSSAS